jgi:hypothetical protein
LLEILILTGVYSSFVDPVPNLPFLPCPTLNTSWLEVKNER